MKFLSALLLALLSFQAFAGDDKQSPEPLKLETSTAPAADTAAEAPKEALPPPVDTSVVNLESQPAPSNGGFPEPEWVEEVYVTWPYVGLLLMIFVALSWGLRWLSSRLNSLSKRTETKVDDNVAAFVSKLAGWTGWVLDLMNGTWVKKK